MTPSRVVILGGGPAGIAAAWQLARQGKAHAVVLEQRDTVGGNAGSFEIDGVPVDYGSHRLHPACDPDILRDLRALLGADLLERPRHGRIRLRGRWIHFPLRALDLVAHMPWAFGLGVARDALRKLAGSSGERDSFASELEHGLGTTICRDFYFPYAVKIWGVAPEELSATQARRRVSAGSLSKMLRKIAGGIPGVRAAHTGRFFYPRQGYGQISGALAGAARAAGAEIHLQTAVRAVRLGVPHRIEAARAGMAETIEADHVWSTIPLPALVHLLEPAPPTAVLEACRRIRYRGMVLVYIVLAQKQFTPYDAHYFPGADFRLTRLSEPKNYSGRCEPVDRTVLCAELPCDVDDSVWCASDAQLAELVRDGLARCDLRIESPVLGVSTKRLPAAYPIYRRGYETAFGHIDEFIGSLEGLLTFGRQGLFAHDNTHHTLAMAYAAVDCLAHDGTFDWRHWSAYRKEFETHVVED